MARLLFLIILCALPPLVVPIHNSSAGGKLCEWMCRNVFDCLLSAFMESSSSAEAAKWPAWSSVICAARKAPVKQIKFHVDLSPFVIMLSYSLPFSGCAIIRPPRDGGIRYRGLTQEQVQVYCTDHLMILVLDFGGKYFKLTVFNTCLYNTLWCGQIHLRSYSLFYLKMERVTWFNLDFLLYV